MNRKDSMDNETDVPATNGIDSAMDERDLDGDNSIWIYILVALGCIMAASLLVYGVYTIVWWRKNKKMKREEEKKNAQMAGRKLSEKESDLDTSLESSSDTSLPEFVLSSGYSTVSKTSITYVDSSTTKKSYDFKPKYIDYWRRAGLSTMSSLP